MGIFFSVFKMSLMFEIYLHCERDDLSSSDEDLTVLKPKVPIFEDLIVKHSLFDKRGIKNSPESRKNNVSSTITISGKRRVKFADENGKPLTSIHMLTPYTKYRRSSAGEDDDYDEDRYDDELFDDEKEIKFTSRTKQLNNIPSWSCGRTNYCSDFKSSFSESSSNRSIPKWSNHSLGVPKCLFKQPAADHTSFMERLSSNSVTLENVLIQSNENMFGTIRVLNHGFQKKVQLRYSTDLWRSSTDKMCSYVSPVSDQNQDVFSFQLTLSSYSQTISFAIRYCVNGEEYWDNNNGINYHIRRERQLHR